MSSDGSGLVAGMMSDEVRRERERMVYTVIRSMTGAWPRNTDLALCEALPASVYSHPQHPTALILCGEYSEEKVRKALGHSNFTHAIVRGRDSLELPFTPPSW